MLCRQFDSILLSGFIWLMGRYDFSAGWLAVCRQTTMCAKVWQGRFFVFLFSVEEVGFHSVRNIIEVTVNSISEQACHHGMPVHSLMACLQEGGMTDEPSGGGKG